MQHIAGLPAALVFAFAAVACDDRDDGDATRAAAVSPTATSEAPAE